MYPGMSMGEMELVIGIIATFPLAFIYRYFIIPYTTPKSKDLILSTVGLALYYFCFGAHCLHALAMILISYIFIAIAGIRPVTCFIVFLGAMGHLMYGYLTVSGVTYTVSWTLIHCQALLKVVGYFVDALDEGVCSPGDFSSYIAYVLFPFTSFVGPQFQYSQYVVFREMKMIPDSLLYAFKRLAIGVMYILIYYGLNSFIEKDYIISEAFLAQSLPLKLLIITFWTKWLISKYLAIWCVAESAALIAGMGYQVETSSWDGISNVDVVKFERSLTIQEELSSFNMQTHLWVKRNVYKRCKFLGSPAVSKVASLTFLYLWHGVYIGFLNLFLVEALGIASEAALNR